MSSLSHKMDYSEAEKSVRCLFIFNVFTSKRRFFTANTRFQVFLMIRISLNNKTPNKMKKKWQQMPTKNNENKTNPLSKTWMSSKRQPNVKKVPRKTIKTKCSSKRSKQMTTKASFPVEEQNTFIIKSIIQPSTTPMLKTNPKFRPKALITKMRRQMMTPNEMKMQKIKARWWHSRLKSKSRTKIIDLKCSRRLSEWST